ncbi:MAG: phospholipid scramblase-related protein [Methylophilaceae bacterium]
MNALLNKNQFFVKEQLGIFKASNSYDIFDPQTSQKVIECREPNLGFLTKIFRFTDYKRMTPFHVEVSTPEGKKILSVKRGFSIFDSKTEVFDENEKPVGIFRRKFFSIGGKFDVLDMQGNVACTLQGKWTSWDFRFNKDGKELAQVTKKWSGFGKELFTTADNYMLIINESVPANDSVRVLIMAAVLCIDMVLKE